VDAGIEGAGAEVGAPSAAVTTGASA
jgi:hypothetical protein